MPSTEIHLIDLVSMQKKSCIRNTSHSFKAFLLKLHSINGYHRKMIILQHTHARLSFTGVMALYLFIFFFLLLLYCFFFFFFVLLLLLVSSAPELIRHNNGKFCLRRGVSSKHCLLTSLVRSWTKISLLYNKNFLLNLQQPKKFAHCSKWINIASSFEICQPV